MAKGPTVVASTHTFRREAQRRIVLTLSITIFINLILVFGLVYIILFPAQSKYYSTSINNNVSPLVSLEEPNISDPAVLQWANQAAIAAFSFDFLNYEKDLEAASEFFTSEGWLQYITALQASSSLDVIRAKKLIVSAVATSPPVILQKGVLNGQYSWRIQMPLLVTYLSASEVLPKNYLVTMLVTRVSTLHSYKGIGIDQFIVDTAFVKSS